MYCERRAVAGLLVTVDTLTYPLGPQTPLLTCSIRSQSNYRTGVLSQCVEPRKLTYDFCSYTILFFLWKICLNWYDYNSLHLLHCGFVRKGEVGCAFIGSQTSGRHTQA